jgi:hypothetical protein
MIGPLACYFDQNSRLDADGIPVMSMLAQRIGSARRRGPPAGAGRQSTWCHARQGLSPAAVKCIRLLCGKARHSVRALACVRDGILVTRALLKGSHSAKELEQHTLLQKEC